MAFMDGGWLKKYYGPELAEKLNAAVVLEGETCAIVSISSEGKMGYVLVRKYGRHSMTQHESLHEGVAGKDDIERMMKRLKELDG